MKQLLRWINKNKTAYFFILPSFTIFIIFLVYPLIKTVVMSFYRYDGRSFIFNGITNYCKIFSDSIFIKSIYNTTFITIFTVIILLTSSILIASFIIDRSQKTRGFMMGIFYLPAVTSAVTICIVWKLIYSAKNGILNQFLNLFGIDNINWLGGQDTALPVIVTIMVYVMIGSPIILYTVAMGAIPKSYYEIAEIEGANYFQKLWNITIPLIKPTTLYLTVISTIGLFQSFVIVKLMTGGGPYYRTTTIAYHLVQTAFWFTKYGLASAIGVVLLIVIAGFTIIQFKLLSEEVEY